MGVTVISHVEQVESILEEKIAVILEEWGTVAERYAMDRAPVDTGRLRNSMTHIPKLEEKAVYIGSDVKYSPYVELGTSKQSPQPFLKPAITDHIDEYKSILANKLRE